MKWTKQLPTVEGYYWVMRAGELTGKISPHVVHVYSSKKGGALDRVFYDGENYSIKCSDIFLEWGDSPIEMPKGNKEQSDATVNRCVDAIRQRFSTAKVVLRPYGCPVSEDIEWFIYVLGIDGEKLCETENACWRIVSDIYGDESPPFLLTAVSPEIAAVHYTKEWSDE